ncbi:MAG: DUF2132 domain-containing protein [Crocinitomicaceae bacterium]|nr:DUF2132 domain-containing protein [Crocinitomicaceae bacterium]
MQQEQPNNPLHGVKLADILAYLLEELGWEAMADKVPIRCFQYDPSIKSSLVFLRKTQWARDQVEELYLQTLKKEKPTKRITHAKYNLRGRK